MAVNFALVWSSTQLPEEPLSLFDHKILDHIDQDGSARPNFWVAIEFLIGLCLDENLVTGFYRLGWYSIPMPGACFEYRYQCIR